MTETSARRERAATPFRLLRPPPATPEALHLDPEQRQVVEHRGGPVLVLAGPGTGKTATLVEAVLDRTQGQDALRPEEILILTFSRAAASELRERICARLPPGTTAPTATTFHSFCYALLGQFQDPALLGDPLRLLSGPEQDVVIRELVRGTIEPGAWGATLQGWPKSLRAALATRGFAEELRGVLMRARDLGLDPEDLAEFANEAGRSDWRAAAHFFGEYLDVADARGILDYAELVHRAVLLCETTEMRETLRARYQAVFVDEYQDTDSAQTRLLRALAGDGRDLVVVGDPDQSIYAFRGADLNNILDFPQTFRHHNGDPARIIVLRTSRRAGPTLLKASRAVARRIPITRLPADQVRQHRDLHPVPTTPPAPASATLPAGAASTPAARPSAPATHSSTHPAPTSGTSLAPDGHAEVITFPDPASELSAIADLLRRANLEDHVPWDQMAVLVRDGQQLAPLRRALLAANVPVEVLGDDLPLAQEPAVGTLLTALRCAAEPAALTPETARALLTGPLGGLDSADLRRLGRALRAEEQSALAATRPTAPSTSPSSAPPPTSDAPSPDPAVDPPPPTPNPAPPADNAIPLARPADHLIREAVADPRVLAGIDHRIAGSALAVARLLQSARDTLDEGGTVEDALWLLWNGDPRARPPIRSGWPERLDAPSSAAVQRAV